MYHSIRKYQALITCTYGIFVKENHLHSRMKPYQLWNQDDSPWFPASCFPSLPSARLVWRCHNRPHWERSSPPGAMEGNDSNRNLRPLQSSAHLRNVLTAPWPSPARANAKIKVPGEWLRPFPKGACCENPIMTDDRDAITHNVHLEVSLLHASWSTAPVGKISRPCFSSKIVISTTVRKARASDQT